MSPRVHDEPDSPIEACLDELVASLAGTGPRELRHLLAEAEGHLRDDAAVNVAAGMTPFAAEELAVQRFGSARVVAGAERDRLTTPLGLVTRQLLATMAFLGAVGAIAVGASGAIAAGVRLIAGDRVLAAPAPGRTLSAADCHRWLGLYPSAGSCRGAATMDWANEIVYYRLALGLLGVVTLLLLVFARNRSPHRLRWGVSTLVTNSVAASLFGVAGVWTLGLGIDAMAVQSGDGAGQWLSAAPVALVAAAVFGIRLLQSLRHADRGLA